MGQQQPQQQRSLRRAHLLLLSFALTIAHSHSADLSRRRRWLADDDLERVVLRISGPKHPVYYPPPWGESASSSQRITREEKDSAQPSSVVSVDVDPESSESDLKQKLSLPSVPLVTPVRVVPPSSTLPPPSSTSSSPSTSPATPSPAPSSNRQNQEQWVAVAGQLAAAGNENAASKKELKTVTKSVSEKSKRIRIVIVGSKRDNSTSPHNNSTTTTSGPLVVVEDIVTEPPAVTEVQPERLKEEEGPVVEDFAANANETDDTLNEVKKQRSVISNTPSNKFRTVAGRSQNNNNNNNNNNPSRGLPKTQAKNTQTTTRVQVKESSGNSQNVQVKYPTPQPPRVRQTVQIRQQLQETRQQLADTRQQLQETRQQLPETRQQLPETRQQLPETRQLPDARQRLHEIRQHRQQEKNNQENDSNLRNQNQQTQENTEILQEQEQSLVNQEIQIKQHRLEVEQKQNAEEQLRQQQRLQQTHTQAQQKQLELQQQQQIIQVTAAPISDGSFGLKLQPSRQINAQVNSWADPVPPPVQQVKPWKDLSVSNWVTPVPSEAPLRKQTPRQTLGTIVVSEDPPVQPWTVKPLPSITLSPVAPPQPSPSSSFETNKVNIQTLHITHPPPRTQLNIQRPIHTPLNPPIQITNHLPITTLTKINTPTFIGSAPLIGPANSITIVRPSQNLITPQNSIKLTNPIGTSTGPIQYSFQTIHTASPQPPVPRLVQSSTLRPPAVQSAAQVTLNPPPPQTHQHQVSIIPSVQTAQVQVQGLRSPSPSVAAPTFVHLSTPPSHAHAPQQQHQQQQQTLSQGQGASADGGGNVDSPWSTVSITQPPPPPVKPWEQISLTTDIPRGKANAWGETPPPPPLQPSQPSPRPHSSLNYPFRYYLHDPPPRPIRNFIPYTTHRVIPSTSWNPFSVFGGSTFPFSSFFFR